MSQLFGKLANSVISEDVEYLQLSVLGYSATGQNSVKEKVAENLSLNYLYSENCLSLKYYHYGC